jgi:hypothetical protein
MPRIRFSDAGEIMSGRLDMTLMYAMHNALRRERGHIAGITACIDDDPRRILASAAGWAMFKKAMHVHHGAEDDALWPTMRRALAGRPRQQQATKRRSGACMTPSIPAMRSSAQRQSTRSSSRTC